MILRTLSILGTCALTACAGIPPGGDEMARLPVVRFGDTPPADQPFILLYPAGAPLQAAQPLYRLRPGQLQHAPGCFNGGALRVALQHPPDPCYRQLFPVLQDEVAVPRLLCHAPLPLLVKVMQTASGIEPLRQPFGLLSL